MVNVFFCVDDSNHIVNLHRCKWFLIVDVDTKQIVDRVKVGFDLNDPELFGDLFEEYDPHILFTCGVNEDLMLGIEEFGVHIYIVKCIDFNDVLDEMYGFRV